MLTTSHHSQSVFAHSSIFFPIHSVPLGIYVVDAAICPQKEYQRTNALDFGLKSSIFSDVDVVLCFVFLVRGKL